MGVGAFRPDAPQARAEVAARAAPAFCSDFASRNADRLCVQHTLRAENVLGVADASDCENVPARPRSAPWTGFSARCSRTATRSRLAPIELDLSSDRNLRPDPMEFFAHSVHGPALPRPRRSPPHGPRTVRREPSPLPSLPGKLPSRALLSGAGTHATAAAQRLALAGSDLRTHVANAQVL